MFKVLKKSKKSAARAGLLRTAHGVVHTPFFMPIATKGAVKGVEMHEVEDLGAEIVLGNTYHLFLQPGMDVLQKFGSIHRFMRTDLPILTDSGGFQVFSLSKIRTVDDHGVTFSSTVDGSKHRLTPKMSIGIQAALGSDIMMAFDYFPGFPATIKQTQRAVKLTTAWAKICLEYKRKLSKKYRAVKKQLLFGIVQGSTHQTLREKSAKELLALDREFSATPFRQGFGGFAIGGLAVGEPAEEMYRVLDYTLPLLPEKKPRYLMGVGYPEQIMEAVKRGIDMFDCVIPTREGRHGRLFVWSAKGRLTGKFYDTLNITNAQFKSDITPVDKTCDCTLCSNYSRAFLHQMFRTQDFLGQRLATIHNLRFYLQLMERIAGAVKERIV